MLEAFALQDILRWFAAATGIAAAIMISLNLTPSLTARGFMVFTGSSIAWVAVGSMTGEPSLTVQNSVLTLINIIGVYRWAGRHPPSPSA